MNPSTLTGDTDICKAAASPKPLCSMVGIYVLSFYKLLKNIFLKKIIHYKHLNILSFQISFIFITKHLSFYIHIKILLKYIDHIDLIHFVFVG